MAEKPGWVAGFDRPRGTEIKQIRGHWYLYERSWRYDPAIRRSRKVSGRCLGKITPEGLVPSVSRAERAERAAAAPAPAVSDVVEVGASALAWSLTGDLREALGRHFPGSWREVYALAVVRAVREPALRRCALHLEDSALFEALGRPSLAPASETSEASEDSIVEMSEAFAASAPAPFFALSYLQPAMLSAIARTARTVENFIFR